MVILQNNVTIAKSEENFCFLCPENSKAYKIWNHVGVTFGQKQHPHIHIATHSKSENLYQRARDFFNEKP